MSAGYERSECLIGVGIETRVMKSFLSFREGTASKFLFSVTFSQPTMCAVCYYQWNYFSYFSPLCLCSGIIIVHGPLVIIAGRGSRKTICKCVLFKQIHSIAYVLWMRTPEEILLQFRNCLLIPDYRLQSVLLESTDLINEMNSRFINN